MSADSDFRFSPRANRAAEIEWRPWGDAAFAEARRLGRPVLLSHLGGVVPLVPRDGRDQLLGPERVIALINEQLRAGARRQRPAPRREPPLQHGRLAHDRLPHAERRHHHGGHLRAAGAVAPGAAARARVLRRQPSASCIDSRDAVARAAEATGVPIPTSGHSAHVAGRARRRRGPQPSTPCHGGIGTEPKFPQADVFAFLLAFADAAAAGARAPRATGAAGEDAAGYGRRRHVRPGRAAASSATRRSATGRSRTTRRCSRTTRASRCSTWTRSGSPGPAKPASASPSSTGRPPTGVIDYLARRRCGCADLPAFAGSQDADETYYKLDAEGREAAPGARRSTRPSTWTGTHSRRGPCCAAPARSSAPSWPTAPSRRSTSSWAMRAAATGSWPTSSRPDGRSQRSHASARRPGERRGGAARRLRDQRRAALARRGRRRSRTAALDAVRRRRRPLPRPPPRRGDGAGLLARPLPVTRRERPRGRRPACGSPTHTGDETLARTRPRACSAPGCRTISATASARRRTAPRCCAPTSGPRTS